MTDRTEELKDLQLYTLAEVEPIVGLTAQTLKRHIKAGDLQAVKVGNKWRVTKANLEKFISKE